MKNLVLVGVSHHTAPIEVRERLAFPEDQISVALQQLRGEAHVQEGLIVSTCNRVEMIADSTDSNGDRFLREFLHRFHRLSPGDLDGYLYTHRCHDVVRHVFRVASSLDSMVVGEPQILSQLKTAYREAARAGSLGRSLKSLLPRAFFVAKRVRNETSIAQSPVSISSVAVELANKIFGDLTGKTILMVGAGKMGELAARNLVSSGAREVFVTNRSPERAHQLAARFHGSLVPFEHLDDYLVRADIVLVSTGASHFVLDRTHMLAAVRRRKYRPLFVIDISVPRNVDPLVNDIENIFVYDVDDLQSVIESNLDDRRREAEIAEEIINQEVENYVRRLSANHIGPLIADLRRRMEEICLQELDRHSGSLEEAQLELMERILKRTAHRLAHPLILKIKETDSSPSRRLHNLELIKQVFDLDEDP